jgi:aspartate/tyrosine/aromatic aminotransferase
VVQVCACNARCTSYAPLQEGRPLVLTVVRQAEAQLLADSSSDKARLWRGVQVLQLQRCVLTWHKLCPSRLSRTQEYAPITGDAEFCRLACQLAFGADHPAITQRRVATVQALSGARSLLLPSSTFITFILSTSPGPACEEPRWRWLCGCHVPQSCTDHIKHNHTQVPAAFVWARSFWRSTTA